jgi:hypothetical protein
VNILVSRKTLDEGERTLNEGKRGPDSTLSEFKKRVKTDHCFFGSSGMGKLVGSESIKDPVIKTTKRGLISRDFRFKSNRMMLDPLLLLLLRQIIINATNRVVQRASLRVLTINKSGRCDIPLDFISKYVLYR